MNNEITICGLDCSKCYCFKNKTCAGCNSCKGKVFHANGKECAIYNCCVTKNSFKNCLECKKAPCDLWEITRDPGYTDEEFLECKKERIELLKSIK